MNTLKRMEALQEAYRVIKIARGEVCNGTTAVWKKLANACDHLEVEMKELLADEPVSAMESAK